jgi:hypothetical protein
VDMVGARVAAQAAIRGGFRDGSLLEWRMRISTVGLISGFRRRGEQGGEGGGAGWSRR